MNVSGAENLDAAGTALFCRDSRGRDTAALTRIDLPSGETRVLAAHDEADIPVTDLLFPDEGHGPRAPGNRLAFFARAEAFLARHLGDCCEPIREAESSGTSMQVMREG